MVKNSYRTMRTLQRMITKAINWSKAFTKKRDWELLATGKGQLQTEAQPREDCGIALSHTLQVAT